MMGSCLLLNQRCVLENQITVPIEATMSNPTRIGDYELLEKKKEGYNATRETEA